MAQRTWKDHGGDSLTIEAGRNHNDYGWVNIRAPKAFEILGRATLREIIAHLQRLDVEVFGEEKAKLDAATISHWQHNLYYDIHPGDLRSTVNIVVQYAECHREELKAVILYLGDSRRPDREFDLSRDDRTEAMMSEEEKVLMPSETIDGVTRWYCSVQRRSK